MYYHGESINVNVQATNNSNKTVKKIKISSKLQIILSSWKDKYANLLIFLVIQSAEIMLYSTTQYKCEVAELEST